MRTRKSPIERHVPASPEPEGGGRFRRHEHLKRRVEITRVFKQGQAVGCFGCKLFFLANGLGFNRIVITFARKYGNAVQRNRTRRLTREAYRLMKRELAAGYDVVVLTYPRAGFSGVDKPSLEESARRLKTLFRRAGMIR